MEHLTVVLDGNYGSYGNNEQFIKLLEDICYCLNAYQVNSFNIFDLLVATSTETRIATQNYRIPLKQKFISIKNALQTTINEMLEKISPEQHSLSLTKPLAKVSLLQNKTQCVNEHIINRKLVLLIASDTIEITYDCEQLLQTVYQIIALGIQTYVVFFSATPEPGILNQLSSFTSGAVIQAGLENARGVLHATINTLPRTDDEAQLIRANAGLRNGNSGVLQYSRPLKPLDLTWNANNNNMERKTQIGPNSCFSCGCTIQTKQLQFFFMCRYCMRLFCQQCIEGNNSNICKCYIQQNYPKQEINDAPIETKEVYIKEEFIY